MTKKEKMDLILTKVAESDKDSFIAEFQQIKSGKDVSNLFKKYHIALTADEKKDLKKAASFEVSDEELDQVSGGSGLYCCCQCSCSNIL